jgi:porin
LRFASNGGSLASPASSGTPAMLSGDFGIWAVFEQQLYRVPKSEVRGIGVFGRVSSSPGESSFEGLFTAIYQYEIPGGWTVQPNFQYILHPGGGARDPLGPSPGRLLRNAMVLGMRTTLKF